MQQPYRLKGRGPLTRKFIIRKESKEQTVELILEAGKTTERNVELFPAKHREEGKPEAARDDNKRAGAEEAIARAAGAAFPGIRRAELREELRKAG